MSIWSRFISRFARDGTLELTEKLTPEAKYSLDLQEFAIQMAINLIAGIIAKCEVKTMIGGKEMQGPEYYLWNYEPNVNQNGTAFMTELISKLIYYNEALCVPNGNDQILIADNFSRKERALYPNSYSGVSRGDFTFQRTFSEPDVLYLRYANADLRGLLAGLVDQYGALLDLAIGKYKRSGGRHGAVKNAGISAGTEDEKKRLNDLYNNRFKSYFQNENGLVVLPRGLDYQEYAAASRSTSEVNDVTALTKAIFSRVAQACRISPALLMGDAANLDSALAETMTIGILPLVDQLETEINRKRFGRSGFLNQCEIRIDTSMIKHFDLLEIAANAEKFISSGMFSVDELRTKVGALPLNTWWSQEHFITRNYMQMKELEQHGNSEN